MEGSTSSGTSTVPSAKARIMASEWMLRRDVEEFFAASRISVRRLAYLAGLDHKAVVGIGTDTWSPSQRTLLMIEAGCRNEPLWPAHRAVDLAEDYDATGFIVRRRMRLDEPNDALRLWKEARRGRETAIDDLAERPNANVIDVAADDPLEYRVLRHAAATRLATGVDKSGRALRSTRQDVYRRALCDAIRRVKEIDTPMIEDVVWYENDGRAGPIYRRLALPLRREKRVISIVAISALSVKPTR